MKKICMIWLLIMGVALYAKGLSSQDYLALSKRITADCSTKYEQAHAIYLWICENISYDMGYSIYTADECLLKRKGVCMAYCELFSKLAQPIGLNVQKISGISKEGSLGHAWLYVKTESREGLLLDPTWGSGAVVNGVYRKSTDYDEWFDVSPEWMIFSHFPDNSQYQFLERQITKNEFFKLPKLTPALRYLGFDANRLLMQFLSGEITSMPTFYSVERNCLKIKNIPMQSTLKVGKEYVFDFIPFQNKKIAIIHNNKWYMDYEITPNQSYRIKIIPTAAGEVSLSVKRPDGMYECILKYEVPRPTAAEMAVVERVDPFSMPEIKSLGGNEQLMQEYGIDGAALLQQVRMGEVTSLPLFYTIPDIKIQIVKAPMNGILRLGKTYVFQVQSYRTPIAVVNEDYWFKNYQMLNDGTYIIRVTPRYVGDLNLYVQKNGGKYYSVLGYKVR